MATGIEMTRGKTGGEEGVAGTKSMTGVIIMGATGIVMTGGVDTTIEITEITIGIESIGINYMIFVGLMNY